MGGAGARGGRGWGVGGAWVGRHLAIPRAIQRDGAQIEAELVHAQHLA